MKTQPQKMTSLDDELDAFLASSDDDDMQLKDSLELNEDDFALKSEDELEFQKVAAELEPSLSNESDDKENVGPEETEEEKLKKQILILQEQLKAKQLATESKTKSKIKKPSSSQKRKNISITSEEESHSQKSQSPPKQKRLKSTSKFESNSNTSFSSTIQNISARSKISTSQNTTSISMMAPVQKSLSEKQRISEKISSENQIIHQETIYSNLKYTQASISKAELTKNLAGKEYKNLHQIVAPKEAPNRRQRSSDENWFTIAIIVSYQNKTSNNGNDFTLCKVTNLYNCPETQSLFLFGSSHSILGKQINEAALVAILSPKVLPPMANNSNSNSSSGHDHDAWKNKNKQKASVALSVNESSQIILIGKKCTDFGYCNGQNWSTNKDGKFVKSDRPSKCKNFINKSLNNLCAYHINQSSKKIVSSRGLFNSTSKPVNPSDVRKDSHLRKTVDPNFNKREQSYNVSAGLTAGSQSSVTQVITVDKYSESTYSNPKNSSSNLEFSNTNKKISGGSKQFNKSINGVTPGAKTFQKHLEQKNKLAKIDKDNQEGLALMNSINRVTDKQKLSAGYQLKGSDLRKAAKDRALESLKSDLKSSSRINKILQRVNLNRSGASTSGPSSSTPKKESLKAKSDYKDLINQKSKFEGQKTKEEERQLELYFSVLEKRDEKLFKDLSTQSESAVVQICHDCKYTYWTVHPNCKAKFHKISSKNVIKKFFACNACNKRRVVTWRSYPTTGCGNCGKIAWKKAGKILFNDTVKLDTEKLARFEEKKWVNSL